MTCQDFQLRLVWTGSEGQLVGSSRNNVKQRLRVTRHTTYWRPVSFMLATLYHELFLQSKEITGFVGDEFHRTVGNGYV